MRRLIELSCLDLCKSLLLSPVAVKELNILICVLKWMFYIAAGTNEALGENQEYLDKKF